MSFKQDTRETPVIFRKWPAKDGGDVIALFPANPGTPDPYTCDSYQHIGQHGSAEPHGVMRVTTPAKPAEYASLRRELEGAPYGYRLKIYSRLQSSFLKMRRDELAKMRA